MPRLTFSSSSIISMALIFGAPVTVPAGNVAAITSKLSMPFFNFPMTLDTICITWEYFSIIINSGRRTVPLCEILPRSFLPRSTSMICSARSLGSFRSSLASASSSFSSAPRLLVPAMGRVSTVPFSHLTKSSGDEPTTSASLTLM